MYLDGDQLQLLLRIYKKNKAGTSVSFTAGSKFKKKDVDELADSGYLTRKGNKYQCNANTKKAISDHGIDIDEVTREPKTRQASGPKRDIREIRERELKARVSNQISAPLSKEMMQHVLLKKYIGLARLGNPWPLIRYQWPFLVIHDPLEKAYFEKHCRRDHNLDLRLDDTQVELIDGAYNPSIKEIAIKGSTSPGKGFATALAVNARYLTWDDRIVIVSSSSKHAKEVMFAEVLSIRKRMRVDDGCENLTSQVKDPDNEKHFIGIANPETGEGLSGGHGEHVTFVFDETTAVNPDLPINARKQANLIIFISNPRILSGFFFDLFPRENPDHNQIFVDPKGAIKRMCLTFGGHGALNVRAKRLHTLIGPVGGFESETLDGREFRIEQDEPVPDDLIPHVKALIPGQMDWAKYSSIMQSPDENERAWSGEGKFPPEDAEFQIIPPSHLHPLREMYRKHAHEIQVTAFGLDLASTEDGDKTALSAGGPMGIKQVHRTQKGDSMLTLRWVYAMARLHGIELKDGTCPVAIDIIGAGGNVMADLMEEQGVWIIRIDSRKSAVNSGKYADARTEIYCDFGERVDPSQTHFVPFLVPDDDELCQELSAHERHSAGGRYRVTPKTKTQESIRQNIQSIKERINRSPDLADAVVMNYHAIRVTELDDNVINQLNPAEVVSSFRAGFDGVELEMADGRTKEADPGEFMEGWGGDELVTIESEIRAFSEELERLRRQ